jgi:hypothetical protein
MLEAQAATGTMSTKPMCVLCEQRRAMAADCVNCSKCCKADPANCCEVPTHAFDPNLNLLQAELDGDLESDEVVEGKDELPSTTSEESPPVATGRAAAYGAFRAEEAAAERLEALTLRAKTLHAEVEGGERAHERGSAQQESESRAKRILEEADRMQDLLTSLEQRAAAAAGSGSREGMLRERAVRGRGNVGRVPPQPLRAPRAEIGGFDVNDFGRHHVQPARVSEFARREALGARSRRQDRDDHGWEVLDEQQEEEDVMGRGFNGLATAGTQVGMDHRLLPRYIFRQMMPNAHAYAMRCNFARFRQKEMCMLGLAVHRLDQEGCQPTAGSGMAVLLRRMAALDALEQGHAGDLADAIEEPGAMLSLYPQLALTQATILAEKRRRLRAKTDKLKPDAVSKPRREP